MFYRLMNCISPSCTLIHSHGKCQWRERRVDCSIAQDTTIHESGTHCSALNDDQNTPLTESIKTYIREITVQGRIWNSMPRKFGVDKDKTIESQQAYKNHRNCTQARVFGARNETPEFIVGWTLDKFGKMLARTGSDGKPFVGGISSKRLLKRFDRPINSFILHLDATFKLNLVDYPVIISAEAFIWWAYVSVPNELTQIATPHVTRSSREPLLISTVIGNAENDQFNAFDRVFGRDNKFIYLMCFYHFVAKVVKEKGIPKSGKGSSMKGFRVQVKPLSSVQRRTKDLARISLLQEVFPTLEINFCERPQHQIWHLDPISTYKY
ncbi:hypothetical protein PHMEG_0005731 [Phytophthora megakarya]|uniref:MULE transposase domain-containing protein n=1 Tax=Phytophthora megakarya TaxID=4795 RepID=A0A225WSB0_9STRA|nr:hypothetical protein PHMEG_0005731 [Phytophthora megakarya]